MLLLDLNPASDFLVDECDGRPVWPIRTLAEQEALAATADLFGAEVRYTRGKPGSPHRTSGEVVVGLGDEVADAGRLYAHLTGRTFRHAPDAGEIYRPAPPAILVTSYDQLDSQMLTSLYWPDRATVPGIICGSEPAQLRRQVLCRAAAASLTMTAERPSRTINLLDAGLDAADPDLVDGRPETEGRPGPRLEPGKPFDVLTVFTHSDGVDAYLGPALTLCSMLAESEGADEKRSPCCKVSGFCHRHSKPLDDALTSGHLLAPHAITARVFAFLVCNGALVAGAPVDSRWGLAPQMLDNPRIGCLVTTWDLNFSDTADIDVLLHALDTSGTIGQAVAQYNKSPVARRSGSRLCLFGDPRLPSRTGAGSTRVRRTSSDTAVPDDIGELAFSRARLEVAVARLAAGSGDGPVGERQRRQILSAQRALESLLEYERRYWTGNSQDGSLQRMEESLRTELIADLHRRRTLPVDDWFALSRRDAIEWRLSRCPACGLDAKSTRVRLRVPGVSPRRLLACARCGIVEDMAAGLPLRLRIDRLQGIVHLEGNLPRTRWSGALQIHSQFDSSCRISPWPSLPDGSAAPGMQTPLPWPAGPLRVSVIVVRGWVMSYVGQEISSCPT